MRTLMRNLVDLLYYPYDGLGTDVNSDGEHTGDYGDHEYGDPIEFKGNISVPSGQTNNTFYGQDIRYTHVLVMDPPVDWRIDEYGLVKWNDEWYEIKAVRPSLNGLSVALRKQTVQHYSGIDIGNAN